MVQLVIACYGYHYLKKWHSFSVKNFFLSGAVEVEVDSVGRILVPDFLKEFAGLATKVVLAGIHDRVEMWDENRWSEYKKRIESQADALAEKLGEIGVL